MTYSEKLIEEFKSGLLLLVKYGLLIVLIVYAYVFMLQTRSMAVNGEQAAIAINQYIAKGWLPQISNGIVPQKSVEAVSK